MKLKAFLKKVEVDTYRSLQVRPHLQHSHKYKKICRWNLLCSICDIIESTFTLGWKPKIIGLETCTSTWSILGNPAIRVSISIIKNVLDLFICKYLYILQSCSLVLYINPTRVSSTSLFHYDVITRFHLVDLRPNNSTATICNKASSGDKLAYGETILFVDIGRFSSSVGIVVSLISTISLGMIVSVVLQRDVIVVCNSTNHEIVPLSPCLSIVSSNSPIL